MKIHKESFGTYLKIAHLVLIKFTINITLFAIMVLSLLKYKTSILLTIIILSFYITVILTVNLFFNKKIISKSLNIKRTELFLNRKKILSENFSGKFDKQEYYKDNLFLLLMGFASFIILFLASIPLIIMVKKIYYILAVIIFALIFTGFFTFNIISPFLLINEYKNREKE